MNPKTSPKITHDDQQDKDWSDSTRRSNRSSLAVHFFRFLPHFILGPSQKSRYFREGHSVLKRVHRKEKVRARPRLTGRIGRHPVNGCLRSSATRHARPFLKA